MLVKIMDIFQDESNKEMKVEFFYTLRASIYNSREIRYSDDSGNLVGTWVGRRLPENDTWYDVEIAINDKLVWGRDGSAVDNTDSWIKSENDTTYKIQGLLEAEKFEFHTLRVGNSLIALRISGVPEPFSGFVQIQVRGIELYDTDTVKF